ncbi:MAG: hypothetical protein UZ12_BCD005002644 [Bacteroidetes bacterium OLB12]|nr:MAG: hypothetical protein UZ12_BCD005002644 [Bacteroidetes bacterium OLB12]
MKKLMVLFLLGATAAQAQTNDYTRDVKSVDAIIHAYTM